MMSDVPVKRCSTCQCDKPLEAFSKKKRFADGLNTQCRTCVAKAFADWYARNSGKVNARKKHQRRQPEYAETRTKINMYQNQQYEMNPDYRAKMIANAKAQNAKKPDHGIGRFQAHIASKPDGWQQEVKDRWMKEHPVEWSAKSQRYAARKRGAPVVENIDLLTLAERDNWMCHLCHTKVTRTTWSMDHLIPLSHGGPHTWDNVALAHRRCNSKRGAGRQPAQLLLRIIAQPQ